MAKSKPEIASALSGSVTTIVALVVAIGELTGKLETLSEKLKDTPPPIIWTVVVVLLLIGVRFLWRGLSRKSRLLKPDVLLIDPDNPRHLKGRGDDIRALREMISHPLVFLEGESGSGKSALIRSGLKPSLTDPENGDKSILPVYINTYPGDWESGPQRQLVSALWNELSEEQKVKLNLSTLAQLRTDLWAVLGKIKNELGITPLLIFDQFDDYQAQHRDKFLRKGKWLTVKQLTVNKTTRNEFWSQLSSAVQSNAVRCLFVTRSDTLGGLESIRFVETEVYYLQRLEPAFIIALLEELVSPPENEGPVISNPQSGWDSLKERLVNDLAYQRRILPIQTRTALKGLIKLPYLSPATYERAGRVEGLESAYIEDGVASAATRSGLNRGTVVQALLQMVDETNPEAPKTASCPQSQIISAISATDEQVGKILDLLGQKEVGIVRRRLGDGENGHEDGEWSLYHDYLARAVLATRRKLEFWHQLLEERARLWKQAGSLWTKWRALLSPWQLLRVLWARVRGKVRLTGFRSYVSWSGLRLVPVCIAIGLLIGALEAGRRYQFQQHARQILAVIRGADTTENPSLEEIRQLWRLATGSQSLKDAFLDETLTDVNSHHAINAHWEYVSQSLFGIDPNGVQRRNALERILDWKVARKNLEVSDPVYLRWAADICNSWPQRFDNKSKFIAKQIVAAMQETTDYDQLSSLGRALGSLGANLPKTKAADLAKQIVAAMQEPTDAYQLGSLGRALGSLGANLPAKEAAEGAKQIVSAMQEITNSYQLSFLGEGLRSLGANLPAKEAAEGAKQIVSAMQEITNSYQLSFLGEGLRSLAANLPKTEAAEVAKQIVAAMQKTTDSDQLRSLGEALCSLAANMPEKMAVDVVKQIVAAMHNSTDYFELSSLGKALGCLDANRLETLAADGARRIVDAMQKTTDYEQLSSLVRALGYLSPHLPETEAAQRAKQIVTAMQKTTAVYRLSSLGVALRSLGANLQETEAAAAANQIVAIMQKTTDLYQLGQLGEALGSLGVTLPETDAVEGAAQIVTAILNSTNSDELCFLGDALRSLAANLPETVAEEVAKRIVTAMQKTTDSYQLGSLGQALGSFGANLPETEAAEGAKQIATAMQNTTNYDQLSSLGQALGSLGVNLPETEVAEGAKQIVAAMQKTTDVYQLGSLFVALRSLSANLPDTELAAVAKQIGSVMAQTTDFGQLHALGEALSWLGAKLPLTAATDGANQIVTAMYNSAHRDELRSLCEVLCALSANLPETGASNIAKQIVTAITNTTDSDHLLFFSEVLTSLGAKLPEKKAAEGARLVITVMLGPRNVRETDALAQALLSLQTVKDIDPRVIEWLKCPLAVGGARSSVLKYLGRCTTGNPDEFKALQGFADWAKENRPDLDLESPPENPFD